MKKRFLLILSILVLSSCGNKTNSSSNIRNRTEFGKYVDKCIEKNGREGFTDGWHEITMYGEYCYEKDTTDFSINRYQYTFIGDLTFLDEYLGIVTSSSFYMKVNEGIVNYDVWYNDHTYFVERYAEAYDMKIRYTYGGEMEKDPTIVINHFYDFAYNYAQTILKNPETDEEYEYTFNEELFTGSYCYQKNQMSIFEDVLYEYSNYELIHKRKSMVIYYEAADKGNVSCYRHGYTDERKTNPIDIDVPKEHMFDLDELRAKVFDPSEIYLPFLT
ncbi:MAG: hypothetical protein ACI4U5_04135 [Bacilli bacterium]